MTKRYKYPRTQHLPWSLGRSEDDLRLGKTSFFKGKEVVITEKMDGENTSLYSDYIHARSIDSRHHVSRDWVKAFHATLSHQIPKGWRFCGENLYARHSVSYDNLKSYFYLFSIWNEKNFCLNWEETLEWVGLLELITPPIFYQGLWDEDLIRDLKVDTKKCEGYVVRTTEGFSYEDFSKHTAKWVRKGHVQTGKNWMFSKIISNGCIPQI